jgi:hypothetical protein|tara:strand:- start:161 stop:538 length:378 start_codon:yes stop_codon:yes gene_type:complete
MNDQKRRFRPRPQRSGFRPRNNGSQNSNGHFHSGGNRNAGNGSMTNPFNVEKAAQKYQQLAKDALTSGDPVLQENYLQHAEHFIRRLAELNVKPKEIKEIKEQKDENTSLAEKLNQKTEDKKKVV